jgi:hypothetical protein
VKHNHSYNSLDCGNKLASSLFHDSDIATKLCCGRTKSELLVKHVLAAKSVEDFVGILNDPTKCSQLFCVATDASNKGSRKLFSIRIRYFDPNKSIENNLLIVVERADETAISISEMLLEKLKAFHLNPKYISVYSADTANVNFGKYHSVFELLRASNADIF